MATEENRILDTPPVLSMRGALDYARYSGSLLSQKDEYDDGRKTPLLRQWVFCGSYAPVITA